MTERLFLEDAYSVRAPARVVAVLPGGVVLDRCVFYARSGGQPGDAGRLHWLGGNADVGEAVKGEGEAIILPLVGEAPPMGTAVEAEIDWVRRYAHMKMHTALHLLCAVLPGAGVTGGQIAAEKSRLDFDLPGAPDREAVEQGLARLIAADHPVSMQWVDESVLDTNPGLVRTLSVRPPRGTGRLRLVRIGPETAAVDLQPCGGTHVARTGEIGALRVMKIENKGKQNRRVTLALGGEA